MPVKKHRKNTSPPKITSAIRKRIKPIKGDKARRYKDSKTGKIYSRRNVDAYRYEHQEIKRVPSASLSIAVQKFYTVVDIYISSQAADGNELSRKEAIAEIKRRKLWVNLHKTGGANKQAWEALTGGDKDEWVPYIQRWRANEL